MRHDQELMKEHIQKSLVFDQIAYLDKLIEEALDGEARDNPGNSFEIVDDGPDIVVAGRRELFLLLSDCEAKLSPVSWMFVLRQPVKTEDRTARSCHRECFWITGYVEEFFEERDAMRDLTWKFAEDWRTLFDWELDQNYLLFTIAEEDKIITCRGGLLVKPQATIDSAPSLDILVVPGS